MVKVTNPVSGRFCVTLDPSISLATVVPTASPDFGGDCTSAPGGQVTFVEPRSTSNNCSASELEFQTCYTAGTTGAYANEPFWFTVN